MQWGVEMVEVMAKVIAVVVRVMVVVIIVKLPQNKLNTLTYVVET